MRDPGHYNWNRPINNCEGDVMADAKEPKVILSRHADQTHLKVMTEVFEPYGTIVPYSDGSFRVVLPTRNSDLAAKLIPYLIDPNGQYAHQYTDAAGNPMKDAKGKSMTYRNNVTAEQERQLDTAAGGRSTPDIQRGKDEKGRVYLHIPADQLNDFQQLDFQKLLDGMLEHLKVPKKTSSLGISDGVAIAALAAAGGQNLNPAEPGVPNGNLVACRQNPPALRQV